MLLHRPVSLRTTVRIRPARPWLSYPSIQRYRLRTVVPCSAASPFSCSTQPFFCSLRMAIPASAARCRASSSWMPASPYFSR